MFITDCLSSNHKYFNTLCDSNDRFDQFPQKSSYYSCNVTKPLMNYKIKNYKNNDFLNFNTNYNYNFKNVNKSNNSFQYKKTFCDYYDLLNENKINKKNYLLKNEFLNKNNFSKNSLMFLPNRKYTNDTSISSFNNNYYYAKNKNFINMPYNKYKNENNLNYFFYHNKVGDNKTDDAFKSTNFYCNKLQSNCNDNENKNYHNLLYYLEHNKYNKNNYKFLCYNYDKKDCSSTNINYVDNKDALNLYYSQLTDFERKEILNYPKVYFVGCKKNKNKPRLLKHNEINCNSLINKSNYMYQTNQFDDFQNSYILIENDHIAYRYEILKFIGKGCFGDVVKAYDHCTGQEVAIKIIKNDPRYTRQANQEVQILKDLNSQQINGEYNVVKLIENFVFRNHVCVVFELLYINLYEAISRHKHKGFSQLLVCQFTYEILCCLELLYQ